MIPRPLVDLPEIRAALRNLATDPSTVHFARNGHAYRGSHTLNQAVADRLEPDLADDELNGAEVWIVGDFAWVAGGVADTQPTRLTAVLVRSGAGWATCHIHRSPASNIDRPGGI